MIGVSILGSTGSIGVSTLDVIRRHPDRYRVVALSANRNDERLFQQCMEFKPEYAVLVDPAAAERMHDRLSGSNLETRLLTGMQGLEKIAALPQVAYVMAAIVGAAGLIPTLSAARAGKRILLANKESLVMSGKILMDAIRDHHAELLPIDSEHNAIFQCMPGDFYRGLDNVGVENILLTASGGPFRTIPLSELTRVTPEQACAHPNWVMGRKISVDSATMMNKGLEVIEACWLFNANPDNVHVVLHPQSVIHSMVQYTDGSVLAQLGNPDMRTPIAHALAWPERISSGVKPLNIFEVARLDFEAPDYERFPCLRLSYEAIRVGGTAPAILNAANEVAVQYFLDGELPFVAIAEVIEETMSRQSAYAAEKLDVILDADQEARQIARELIQSKFIGVKGQSKVQ